MCAFAESEIVLPSGPNKGERFKAGRQPFARLFFNEVDSGRWTRFAVTGPRQTGKSLISYIIPALYHLFEYGETVILLAPSMVMAADKWREDLLPAIEASRYRELLPRQGAGSRGGAVDAVRFRNGATLKFMSGGGSDKKRAAFTARVLLVTEADGMDKAASTSRESNPIDQASKCNASFGDRARQYDECTVSIEGGYIWQSYTNGSASRIILPCPHCGLHVTPEREHLKGWQGADDALAAEERSHIACPECGEPWTEAQRIEANHHARILHKGQEVTPEGEIVGPPPRTRTLGFRWTAANNMFASIGMVGAEEWSAANAINTEEADRKMRQFVWALPAEPDEAEVVSLTIRGVTERMSATPQGLVPAWCDALALGVDCGQYLLHWVLLGADLERKRHVQVVDYGVEEVHSRQFRVEEALSMALGSLAGRAFDADQGWPDEAGNVRHPDLAWYDSGWKPVPVYKHCRAMGARHWPAKGQGLGQYGGVRYIRPKTTGAIVTAIFDEFHLAKFKHSECGTVQLYEFNADQAKARVQNRLAIPMDDPGAMLLPQARAVEHTTFAKHLLAEQLITDPDDGLQKWQKTPGHGGHNHYLDAAGMALTALMRRWSMPKPVQHRTRPVLTAPDGRPYLATQR